MRRIQPGTLVITIIFLRHRVAGGWVRDKLLRQQSVDIDIALDDQTGTEFANSLNDYLKYLNMETRTICVIQVR